MASSRLLHLVFSPSPAAGSALARSFRRSIHVVAATATSPESQHLLQFKLEGIISIVGGEMVVADMRFARDSFDYWRNAAIPSSSIVKELASTWANAESLSTTPNMPFKFYADRTMGKKMEDFLQRMIVDVEQKITKEGFNPLKGRRLDVQLADKEELMAREECPDSKQAFDRRLRVQSADEQVPMVQKLESLGTNQGSQSADQQEILAKEGKSEAEKGLDRRLDLQGSMAEDKDSEHKQGSNKTLDVQLADEQDLVVKVENSYANQGRSEEETVGQEEISEVMQVQSENEQDIMCTQEQSLEAQKEEAKNWHVTIGKEDIQSVANGQKTMEKEKMLDARHSLKEKEGAEMQNAKARKQLANEQEIMAMSMRSAARRLQQSVEAQIEKVKIQHAKEKEIEREDDHLAEDKQQSVEAQIEKAKIQHAKIEREDDHLAEDKQKSMEKEKKSVAMHMIEEKEGAEVQKAEERAQNYGAVKDHYQQQTDNIVRTTRRMGRKIVHIYYDKSSAGRVSL